MEARDFLKAACSQPSADIDASRPSSAGRYDFLIKNQTQQPSVDPSLAFLSKNWVPVGTRPVPSAESSERTERSILHRIFSQQPTANEGLTAEALAALQAQALAKLPQHVQSTAEGDESARRVRKRERQNSEVVVEARWSLKQKLAALTQDIELLTQEIALVRDEADASCAAPRLTLEEKAAIAERHARKQAESQKRGMAVMLRDIMAHKFANPFLKPVDTNLYPDYPLKVPHPLDFGTVKARLDAGKYTSNMEAFAKDMQQIFDNAFIYNAPGSTVHQWAVLLKDKFEERFKSLNARLAGMEGEQRKEEEDVLDVAKRRLQDRAWEGLTTERQRFEPLIASVEARIKDLKTEAAANCTFVPVPEQHALMYALQELKSEDYDQAIQIIVNRHPGLLQGNPDVLNVDCGPLDALTLRQLAAFCHFCLKGTKLEFSNGWPGLLFGTGARGIPAAGSLQQPQSVVSLQPDANKKQKVSLIPDANVGNDRKDQATVSEAAPAASAPPKTNPRPEVVAFTDPQGSNVKALSVQTREVGERSWSVLDTEAVTGLKAELKAAASQIAKEQ